MIEVSTYSQIVQVVPLSGPSELTVSPQLLKRVSCQSNVSRGKSVIGAFICPLTAPVALRLEVLASALEVGAVADVQMGDVALLGAEDGLSVVILGISQCLCHIRGSNRGCIRGRKGGGELSECRKGNGEDGVAHGAGVSCCLMGKTGRASCL